MGVKLPGRKHLPCEPSSFCHLPEPSCCHRRSAAQWLLPPGIRLGGTGGAGDLPRPRHSELGPRPPRNLPRATEAGEGTGLGRGRRLLGITCPQVPKHGANTVPVLKELESLPKAAETSRQPSPHCTDGEGEVDKRSPGIKATPSSLGQISTMSLEP